MFLKNLIFFGSTSMCFKFAMLKIGNVMDMLARPQELGCITVGGKGGDSYGNTAGWC
jgi:hypothetical protein